MEQETIMDIKMNMSARLSLDDLKGLIREAMQQHTGRQVANIEFTLSEVGGYMDRGGSYQVSGCTVVFVAEPVKSKVTAAISDVDRRVAQGAR